jgi:hypothetical protein
VCTGRAVYYAYGSVEYYRLALAGKQLAQGNVMRPRFPQPLSVERCDLIGADDDGIGNAHTDGFSGRESLSQRRGGFAGLGALVHCRRPDLEAQSKPGQ